MQISDAIDFADATWQPFDSSVTWTLSDPDGLKAVYARFRDADGNVSETEFDRITLDRVRPAALVAALDESQGEASFIVFWSGSDATSGVATYVVQDRDDGEITPGGDGTPGAWIGWRSDVTGTGGLFAGEQAHRYCFRVRATDRAGNLELFPGGEGDGCTRVADIGRPAGTVIVEAGADFTKTAAVELTLDPADNIGVTEMQIANGPDFSTAGWQPADASAAWVLSPGDGVKRVYARFRDADGNISATASDEITLDRIAPTGTMTINQAAVGTASPVVIIDTTASDDRSGLDGLRLSADGQSWSGWSADSRVQWELAGGSGTRAVYAQFRDRAGNLSEPASAAIDLDTSVGSDEWGVSVNDGASFTNSVHVVLTLQGKVGTSQMRISNDGGFAGARWEPYTPHKAWDIRSFSGQAITDLVYVQFRDVFGATSDKQFDDIVLDPNPPQLTAPGGAGVTDDGAAGATFKLNTRASDDRSGVVSMQVSNSPSFAGAQWERYQPAREWPISVDARTTVYMRFRDGAGNVSRRYASVASRPGRTTVPVQVTPVHALVATSSRPVFSWLPVVGAENYELQVSAQADFTPLLMNSTTSDLSTRPPRLPVGKRLFWRVRVEDGAWSPAWEFTAPAVSAPSLVSPPNGASTTSLTPLLRWARVPLATAYDVEVGPDPAFFQGVHAYRTAGASFHLPPLAAGARYYWRVRARTGSVVSAWSDPSSFTSPDLSAPVLMKPLANARVTTPVVFTWQAVPGARKYAVQLCSDAGCTEIAKSLGATQARVVLPSLGAGTYWWRVRATGARGVVSAWSGVRSFRR